MKQKKISILKISGFVLLFIAIVFLHITLFGWIDDLFGQELTFLEIKLQTQVQQFGNEFEFELLGLPAFVKIAYNEFNSTEEQLVPIITNWKKRNIAQNIFSNIYLASLDKDADIQIFKDNSFQELQDTPLSKFVSSLPNKVTASTDMINNIYYSYDESSMFVFLILKEISTAYLFICEVDIDILKEDIISSAADKYFPLEYGYEIRILDTRTNSIVYSNRNIDESEIFENPDMIYSFVGANVQNSTTSIGESNFLLNISTQNLSGSLVSLFDLLIGNLPFIPDKLKQNAILWHPITSSGEGRALEGMFEISVNHKKGSQIKAALAVTQVIIGITICTMLLLLIEIIIIYASLQKNRKFAQHQQEFIDTVTHELKTPISTISVLSQNIMKGAVRTPEKFSEYAVRIRYESLRLKQTVEYFLLYSKLRHNAPHKMELCNLNDIICDVYTQYVLQFEQQDFITEITVPEEDLYINANLYAIELIIRNLLENILKYAKDGRYVSVKLYSHMPQADKKFAVLEFTDKGSGIPLSEQKKVFEYFTRGETALQKQIQGSGIGLYLVKSIVEFHGGTVRLKSKLGEGSTFIVSLPIAT